MFGIDLGITVASISCVTNKREVLDFQILFGDTTDKDEWRRVNEMTDAILDGINVIVRSNAGVHISPLAAIEEPVLPWGNRNPKVYFTLCMLYTLVRYKLLKRGYKIHSVHPLSAKATARSYIRDKNVGEKYIKARRLTKDGMILAYQNALGKLPDYHTKAGRETLADSYFIALTGLERRRVGVKG